jgi:hypothetical protein
MLKRIIIIFLFQFLCALNVFCQLRTLSGIFPDLSGGVRTAAMEESGYIKYSKRDAGIKLICGEDNNSGINPVIAKTVLDNNPGYVVESINVISAAPGSVSLLDIYNALGNIRDLKGRLYPSHTKKQDVPLFEEASRIVSIKKTTSIPDPPPALILPNSEVIYLKLKDTNFGYSYYTAEMQLIQNGLRYKLTNSKNLTYILVPVIREGKFIAQMYIEPIQEGVLIYSIAAADVSNFVASQVDIESAIAKRLNVIISWTADGIRKNSFK